MTCISSLIRPDSSIQFTQQGCTRILHQDGNHHSRLIISHHQHHHPRQPFLLKDIYTTRRGEFPASIINSQ
ncbi:uncharacterized protein BP01DRAFT_214123 [Aspergillus saccharolyticus JOP 1030-1]|uniref:Uncharacterized protein n=1 Tax=Aspergillus saccharolyticus JOP 1030-1 TaxID=1450539 RepID=A0A318ZIM6_9EURO|nr:hypothetical protein BP01DRAFT_214123 [Aspergillus saccharolyticus JOP 1030-1]PYH47369.1 hypothetical protein BP01DRAFT_214123 [Aspergillus saccharolyticus JOP 1030-1]